MTQSLAAKACLGEIWIILAHFLKLRALEVFIHGCVYVRNDLRLLVLRHLILRGVLYILLEAIILEELLLLVSVTKLDRFPGLNTHFTGLFKYWLVLTRLRPVCHTQEGLLALQLGRVTYLATLVQIAGTLVH